MRSRFLVLALALVCLLTAQCLLACSTAQQAAHACCPHQGSPDRTVDASIPASAISAELNCVALLIPIAGNTLQPSLNAPALSRTASPPEPPPAPPQVLRV